MPYTLEDLLPVLEPAPGTLLIGIVYECNIALGAAPDTDKLLREHYQRKAYMYRAVYSDVSVKGKTLNIPPETRQASLVSIDNILVNRCVFGVESGWVTPAAILEMAKLASRFIGSLSAGEQIRYFGWPERNRELRAIDNRIEFWLDSSAFGLVKLRAAIANTAYLFNRLQSYATGAAPIGGDAIEPIDSGLPGVLTNWISGRYRLQEHLFRVPIAI